MQLQYNRSIDIPIRPRTFCFLEPHSLTFTKSKDIGRLLVLIYINDIINSINILSFVLFADDTTVYVKHDSIDGAIQILNSELVKVAE